MLQKEKALIAAIDKLVVQGKCDNDNTKEYNHYFEILRQVDSKACQVGISFYDMFSLLFHTGNFDSEIEDKLYDMLNNSVYCNQTESRNAQCASI